MCILVVINIVFRNQVTLIGGVVIAINTAVFANPPSKVTQLANPKPFDVMYHIFHNVPSTKLLMYSRKYSAEGVLKCLIIIANKTFEKINFVLLNKVLQGGIYQLKCSLLLVTYECKCNENVSV